jgi:hypothetical protein
MSIRRIIFVHPYTLLSLAVLAGMGIEKVVRKSSEWQDVYLRSARALLRHEDFMAVFGNTYPPFGALFHIPFAVLPPLAARACWVIITITCFVYFVRKSWQLSGGARLQNNPAAKLDEHLVFLLGMGITLQFALNVFGHLQTDLLIAALLTAGCASMAAGRYVRAGAWIGLAAAFKATPLLFAPYLLWRRQWAGAACLVAVALGVSLLPDLIERPPDGGVWVARWFNQYVRPMGKSNYAPGDWNNLANNNQAIAGAVRRWFTTAFDARDPELPVDHPERMSTTTQRAIFFAFALLVMIPVAYAMWRGPPVPANIGGPRDGGAELSDPLMLECGIVMLLMLLFSPNSSRAHFCIMLLPAFCVARYAVRAKSIAAWTLLILSLVSSTLSIHIRVGSSAVAEQFLLWVGVVMFSALFLLLGCVVALVGTDQMRREVPSEAASQVDRSSAALSSG